MNDFLSALNNTIPYDLYFKEGEAMCRWLNLGDKKFTEPFFDDTIHACRYSSENINKVKCISHVDALPEWFKNADSIEPSVFIFHVSRCGSTLASQLLALNDKNIVLSEVPFFDQLLRWRNLMPEKDEEKTLQQLKASIACYAQKRNGNENRLIIKTDSWHVFFYNQLRKLYPQTPFILLYRKPDEVIASHQKRRGMQAVQGIIEPEIFGFDKEAIYKVLLDEYMSMVLEKYYAEFLRISNEDSLSTLINYNEGAIEIIKKTAVASNIQFTEEEMDGITERSSYHAKYPGQKFTEEALHIPVPAYQEKVFELYDLLEIKRKATNY